MAVLEPVTVYRCKMTLSHSVQSNPKDARLDERPSLPSKGTAESPTAKSFE
jgi:hypothetical protein